MEYERDDEEGSQKITEAKGNPMVKKRTPRMLHESSFATSAFASSRSQSRPPGFIASSLDFKSSAGGAVVAPDVVTTKPGRNKKNNNKQEQEQLERERQYQQQRQYRSGHPTRAQGNFGPPPHSVKSLEDLENMTEEQIYKLFMDDPDLHQAFIKATEKEDKGNSAPSSAPVGAKKGRSSAGGKPSNYSKSKRSSANVKSLKFKNVEREVPYFQWLFLFFLIGAAIYKICKSYSSPTTTKELSRSSRNSMGKRQKKKQGTISGNKSSTKNIIIEDELKANLHRDNTEAFEENSSRRRKKKKKKPSKARSTILSISINDEEKENNPTQETHRRHKLDLESTDASTGNNEAETSKLDRVVQAKSGLASSSTTNENDEAWQTVTKSSKPETAKLDHVIQAEFDLASSPDTNQNDEAWQTVTKSSKLEKKKKATIDPNLVEEKKVLEQPVVDNMGDGDVVEQSMGDSDFVMKKIEKDTASNDEKEKTHIAQPSTAVISEPGHIVEEKKIVAEVKHIEQPDIDIEEKSTIAIQDDAALALQLHKEEVNLARTISGNPQEEAWEEVTLKKKKRL